LDRNRGQGTNRATESCDLEEIHEGRKVGMEIEWYIPSAPVMLTRQVCRLSKKLLSVWLEGLGFKPTIYGKQVQSRRLTISCFLAQDRVAEFAKMSPPLTLKETMRAAGDPRLTEWHQKLVTRGIEKKALDEKLNTDIARRDQVKTQMDKIQPDVEQFETRQEKEKEVSSAPNAWPSLMK